MSTEQFETWAIVEVMGHKRFAGWVTEQRVAGHGFVRVDVPAVRALTKDIQPFTKLFGASSIYAITPVPEEVARRMAAHLDERPVHAWELPPSPALPAPADDAEFDIEEID